MRTKWIPYRDFRQAAAIFVEPAGPILQAD
jgi:hypothetical protein